MARALSFLPMANHTHGCLGFCKQRARWAVEANLSARFMEATTLFDDPRSHD